LRVLITGGTGFVGTHLISFLKSQGAAIAVMAPSDGTIRDPEINLYEVDIRDAQEVKRVVAEVQPAQIYHLAGVSAIDVSWRDPQLNFEVNVGGAYNLFAAAMALPAPPRILNISTSQVYAPSSSALSENDPMQPGNPYAASKAMAELIRVQYLHHTVGGIVTSRSFNHTGPGQSANFVVSSMAKQFAEIALGVREPRLTVGNIQVKRDFTDVRDVVRAYGLLLEHGATGEVYNVCSGVAVRLADILEMLQSICGVKVKIEIDPGRIRTSDPLEIRGNPQKLQEATGWRPQIPLLKTLFDSVDAWKAKLKKGTLH
jgi:GDP-4-dehydro-6-deoxy-D-mannose reductase